MALMLVTAGIIVAMLAGSSTVAAHLVKAIRWLLEGRIQLTVGPALSGQVAPVFVSNYGGLAVHAHVMLRFRPEVGEKRRHTKRAELMVKVPRWGVLRRDLLQMPLSLEDGAAVDLWVETDRVHELIVRGEALNTGVPLRWDVTAWVVLHMDGAIFPLVRRVDVTFLKDVRRDPNRLNMGPWPV